MECFGKIGDFKYQYTAICIHPKLRNNSTEAIGCKAQCDTCKYCKVTIDAPTLSKLEEMAAMSERK